VALYAAERLGKTRTTLQTACPAEALITEDLQQEKAMSAAVLPDAAALDT
jgi:hypothetical protein